MPLGGAAQSWLGSSAIGKSPQTDPAEYGMQGFTAYIKNAGVCYDVKDAKDFKDAKALEKTCK